MLIAEQQSDASLRVCWEQAKVNKSDFVVSEGVLYHKDKVEGQPICQLCVPEGRHMIQCLNATWESARPGRELDCCFTGPECLRAFRSIFSRVLNVSCNPDH